MRQKFIAGNWKMFTTAASGEQLAVDLLKGLGSERRVTVAVCPPFPYLAKLGSVLKGTNIALGAQNVYPEKEGAFTGEVSPAMLLDVGCKYVIVGHSERRKILGETDAFINKKVHAALTAGLEVILAIGETLEEREANQTEKVLDTQLTAGLAGINAAALAKITLAYEPVWAIGTGKTATSAQAEETHAWLRSWLTGRFSGSVAEQTRIQYGGSVKPDNAAELMSQPNVDGALVGGASLKVESFAGIIQAAAGIRR